LTDENYADRLEAAMEGKGSAVCVGLDPRPALLPSEFRVSEQGPKALASWAAAVMEVVAPYAPVVKPQIAFFEAHGHAGFRAFEQTVAAAREQGLLVIADAKRGDIGSTAEAYAAAHFDRIGADALTVNPYMGRDTLEPFLQRCRDQGKGIYALVRTSNPGAGDVQDLPTDGGTVFERVAAMVDSVGSGDGLVGARGMSSVGAVTGATYPKELGELRTRMPRTPLLVPGYGAQGGGAADCAGGFRPDGGGAVVNSSRGITFAFHKGEHAELYGDARWRDSVEAAVREMRDALNAVRGPEGEAGA